MADWAYLTDDVFESVLALLEPHQQAALRCTCQAWRTKTSVLLQTLAVHPKRLPEAVSAFPGVNPAIWLPGWARTHVNRLVC